MTSTSTVPELGTANGRHNWPRIGTKRNSLATSLIGSQDNAICFHEANVSGMPWAGTEPKAMALLQDFWATPSGAHRGISTCRAGSGAGGKVPAGPPHYP